MLLSLACNCLNFSVDKYSNALINSHNNNETATTTSSSSSNLNNGNNGNNGVAGQGSTVSNPLEKLDG